MSIRFLPCLREMVEDRKDKIIYLTTPTLCVTPPKTGGDNE